MLKREGIVSFGTIQFITVVKTYYEIRSARHSLTHSLISTQTTVETEMETSDRDIDSDAPFFLKYLRMSYASSPSA